VGNIVEAGPKWALGVFRIWFVNETFVINGEHGNFLVETIAPVNLNRSIDISVKKLPALVRSIYYTQIIEFGPIECAMYREMASSPGWALEGSLRTQRD
jgi:hypothetical protein